MSVATGGPQTPAGPVLLDDEHVVVRGLWRAVDVFRVLALIYAAYSVWERRAEVAHLSVAAVVLGVLAGWTAVQTVRPMRTVRAYTVELAIGCGAILGTRLVDTPATWPSRRNRATPGDHSRTAVCHWGNGARGQKRSWSELELAPMWCTCAQEHWLRSPSGQSISPPAGQVPLSGHSSHAVL